MIPLAFLPLAPSVTVARDAGLVWSFDGTVRKASGRYLLAGKALRGEIAWSIAPTGRYDAEALYEADTRRTKEADATKAFRHVRRKGALAGVPAIVSEQTYRWDGAAVASRCVYAAKGRRAWTVRLWWPAGGTDGGTAAEALLKSFREIP